MKAAALARKEAAGDFSHLKNKKGELIHKPLPQPTLPNISLDDEFQDTASVRTRELAGNTSAGDPYFASDHTSAVAYPPANPHNQPYSHHQDPNAYARYNASIPHLQDEAPYHDDYGSTANLASAAAPPAQQSDVTLHNPYDVDYVADLYDIYSGNAGGQYRAQHDPHTQYYHSQQSPETLGLSYDSSQPYHISTMAPPQSQTPLPPYSQYGHRSPSPQQGIYEYRSDNKHDGQFHAI